MFFSPRSRPYFTRWTIDRLLRRCVRMHRRHQRFDNAELLVNDLGQWGQTVGGTRSIGNDGFFAGVFILVDTHDEHGRISGWSGDDHFLRTSLNMRLAFLHGCKHTGRFDDVFST